MDHPALRGRHVILEPLLEQHAAELWPAASEHELWRFMIHDVRTRDDLVAWVRDRIAARKAGTALPFVQRDALTGAAFGSTSIFDITRHGTMEVGHTWIGASHRRTAANTEAKRLVLEHCFDALGAIRVQLKCDERNARSRAAIERLGASFEGILRNQMTLPNGHKRQAATYSILDTEWPDVRRRLNEALARTR